MNFRILRLCPWLLLLIFTSCVSPAPKQITGRERFALTTNQLEEVQAQALRGRKESLRQVVNYWLFYQNRPDLAKPWIERAKKAGAVIVEP
jgi:hypothetical protein